MKYPIKNENGEVIGYKDITKIVHAENCAAVIISVDEGPANIVISYTDFYKMKQDLNDECN